VNEWVDLRKLTRKKGRKRGRGRWCNGYPKKLLGGNTTSGKKVRKKKVVRGNTTGGVDTMGDRNPPRGVTFLRNLSMSNRKQNRHVTQRNKRSRRGMSKQGVRGGRFQQKGMTETARRVTVERKNGACIPAIRTILPVGRGGGRGSVICESGGEKQYRSKGDKKRGAEGGRVTGPGGNASKKQDKKKVGVEIKPK